MTIQDEQWCQIDWKVVARPPVWTEEQCSHTQSHRLSQYSSRTVMLAGEYKFNGPPPRASNGRHLLLYITVLVFWSPENMASGLAHCSAHKKGYACAVPYCAEVHESLKSASAHERYGASLFQACSIASSTVSRKRKQGSGAAAEPESAGGTDGAADGWQSAEIEDDYELEEEDEECVVILRRFVDMKCYLSLKKKA